MPDLSTSWIVDKSYLSTAGRVTQLGMGFSIEVPYTIPIAMQTAPTAVRGVDVSGVGLACR